MIGFADHVCGASLDRAVLVGLGPGVLVGEGRRVGIASVAVEIVGGKSSVAVVVITFGV
ncbi:MAG TPA: hypothetical protein PK524_00730 [Brevefilum fermentans]|jgi:hypothetical protein|nr:hypothetical protein [Brevefilum fermentans]HPX94835.1 hypothetical protein [Brevefilum fermentans]